MNAEQLHKNIIEQKLKNRYTYDDIGDALGLKKRGFIIKMERLKNGNTTTVSCRDIARMMKLFGCTAQALMNGVSK